MFESYSHCAEKVIDSSCTSMEQIFDDLNSDIQEELTSASDHQRQMYLRLIQLESTRLQRVSVVSKILPFEPLVVGDERWKDFLAPFEKNYNWCSRIDYTSELPNVFQGSLINFNQSSLQSAGALNQRVFDVPACNSFLLTDYYPSLENLFEPGKEVACYKNIDEIDELIRMYLDDEKLRKKISEAGKKRVLAEHTYKHRAAEIVQKMLNWF